MCVSRHAELTVLGTSALFFLACLSGAVFLFAIGEKNYENEQARIPPLIRQIDGARHGAPCPTPRTIGLDSNQPRAASAICSASTRCRLSTIPTGDSYRVHAGEPSGIRP